MSKIEKHTRENMRIMLLESTNSVFLANYMIVRITIFSIIIGIIIYLLLTYAITNPLIKIQKSTDAISKGNYNFNKIVVNSKDEIGMLAASFNSMTNSLKIKNKKEQIINEKIFLRSQRLASLGELSASIAHEIRQPLNVVKLTADSFIYLHNQKKRLPKICRDNLNKIKRISENSEKINNLIENIYNIIKKPNEACVRKIYININKEISKIVEFYIKKLKKDSIELNLQFDEKIDEIKFSEIQFQEILSNILNNAIDAYNGLTKINKKIIIKTKNNKNFVLLEIIDNARGINYGMENKIFDPLFSMSTKKESLGLGLFIVNKILDTNNSSIEVINNNKGGATFQIFFPKINNFKN